MKLPIYVCLLILFTAQQSWGSSSKPLKCHAETKAFMLATKGLIDDVGIDLVRDNWPIILVERPMGAIKWDGPYMIRIPKDPWGKSYVLQTKDKNIVGVYSYGENGVNDNGKLDDISSWNGYEENVYFPERKRNRILVQMAMVILLFSLLSIVFRRYRVG